MSKCKKVNISNKARMELHDALSLTGAEISIIWDHIWKW